MQKLIVKGEVIGEYHTRVEALVECFERGLVYDQHARKRRNNLLPWVKIDGVDEIGYLGSRALEGSVPRSVDGILRDARIRVALKRSKVSDHGTRT